MSSEDKKKRKEEKIQKLRQRQEEALRLAHEEEEKANQAKIDAKRREEIPDEMIKKGYKLTKEELSNGQFSIVFKAKLNDQNIAVRVIEKQGKDNEFLQKLIPRLVKILRVLDERHPNIVSTLDVFETSKRVLIPMRLAPNGSLYDYIDKQTDPIDEKQCRKWSQQLISGLCYLHINGIVHKNLRTEHILLDEINSLKISGFTYSRLWMNPSDNSLAMSKTCVGSGPYCAPETLTGESYDPRTADVWSYGVVVYYIWNKCYPFDFNMTHRILAQHKSNEWINRIRSDSSDAIKEFFRKTFDVNHNQRQTIVDLLKDKWIDSKITVVLDVTINDSKKRSNDEKDNLFKDHEPKTIQNKEKPLDSSNSSETKKEEDLNEDSDVIVNDDDDEDSQNSSAKNDNQNSAAKNDSPNSAAKNDSPNSAAKNDSPNGAAKKDSQNSEKPEVKKEVKHNTIDTNVLRPDILDQLKQDLLSIK